VKKYFSTEKKANVGGGSTVRLVVSDGNLEMDACSDITSGDVDGSAQLARFSIVGVYRGGGGYCSCRVVLALPVPHVVLGETG